MKAVVLIPIALLCYIWALMLAQFGPFGMRLANWICIYASLLILIAIAPAQWLGGMARPLIIVPPVVIILHALLYRN